MRLLWLALSMKLACHLASAAEEAENRKIALGKQACQAVGWGFFAICGGCYWGLWALCQVILQALGETIGYASRCGSLQLCGKCGGTTLLGPGKGPGGDVVRGNPSPAVLTCLPALSPPWDRPPPLPGTHTTALNPPPAPESLPGFM